MKVLKIIGVILLVIIVVVAILAFVAPTQMKTERSVKIDAPKELVYDYLLYFEKSNQWSPWMKLDTNMETRIEGEDGTEFATLSSGDFFGETALISEDKRSANAKALGDCRVIAFFRSDLLEIIRRSPVFGTKILFNLSNIMAARLKKTNKLLQETNPNFNESKYS